jgi:hypothetical protein
MRATKITHGPIVLTSDIGSHPSCSLVRAVVLPAPLGLPLIPVWIIQLHKASVFTSEPTAFSTCPYCENCSE